MEEVFEVKMAKFRHPSLTNSQDYAEGKYVEGSLHRDKWTGQITFRAYNRQSRKRKKDKLIRYLEHGWVKESTKNLKYYESIPKKIGMASVISVLERDTKVAKEALVDYELINRV